jgi:arylsulfatase
VLVAQGGRFGGWSLYLKDGVPTYAYSYGGIETVHVRGERPVGDGDHVLELLFSYDGGGYGRGGDVRLVLDGSTVAEGRLERTLPFMYSIDQTLNVGIDRGTPVTDDYGTDSGFRFTGTVHGVLLETAPDEVAATLEQYAGAVLAAQ